jgi:hypothetical protein
MGERDADGIGAAIAVTWQIRHVPARSCRIALLRSVRHQCRNGSRSRARDRA